MRQLAQILVIGLLVAMASTAVVVGPVGAQSAAEPGEDRLKDLLEPRALGNDDAPVTIVEYSSLTCPHCATFHRDTLPQLKAGYIDTGKVRLVFNDFPLDVLALGASMIARCVERDRYFEVLDRLFREQSQWARSEDPRAALAAIAKSEGLSEAAFNACLGNGKLMTGLRTQADEAAKEHAIRSTPTFLVNGDRVEGTVPYDRFKDIIDRKLGEDARETTAPAGLKDG